MLRPSLRHRWWSIILLLCLLSIIAGCWRGSALFAGGGIAGLCCLVLMMTRARNPMRQDSANNPTVSETASPIAKPAVHRSYSNDPIEKMVSQSRYALLLMRQMVEKLSEEHYHLAIDAFQREMAIVPAGDVDVTSDTEFFTCDSGWDPTGRPPAGRISHVEAFFLDRCPVTNRQYREFVASGGYCETVLWDENILPALLDMVDQTGLPGPRFWRDGCYLPGEEDLPVVGISWYEAAACARWMCKRLPTDAEWVKAASWPVPIDAKTLAYRRYPWGDAMDCTRANVWASGANRLVAVQEFAAGTSVGGINQLIGNVWEWIDGEFYGRSSDGDLQLATPMKSIRGGAFDTYFDSQATSQFQSGENPLNRRHNIGFRCAISMGDVVLTRPLSAAPPARLDKFVEGYKEMAT